MFAVVLIIFTASNQISFAEDTIFNSRGGFIKNMEQLLDTDGEQAADVLYYAPTGNIAYYLLIDKISYVFNKGIDAADDDTLYRMDLILADNSNVVQFRENNQMYYDNFYLAHTGANGIDSVGVFESVDYTHLYENILVNASLTNGLMLKYVVDTGANPYDLAFYFDGADSTVLDNDGNIRVYCPLDSVVFDSIYAYQVIDEEEVRVDIAYRLDNDHVSFDVGTYDDDYALIIVVGPQPIHGSVTEQYWSTFLQGGGDESYDVFIDVNNFVYCTGSTTDPNFPAIGGQFMYNPFHGIDAFVIKFDTIRKIEWGSFFGGDSTDIGRQVVVNSSGYVYIAGITAPPVTDSIQVCTTCNADATYLLDSTYNGGDWDIFIAVFGPNGKSDPTSIYPDVFRTYFGGSGNEEIYGMTIDTNDIVYLSGYADTGSYNQAVNPFPYVPMTNAYNQDFDLTYSGRTDAFVVAIGQGTNTPNDVLWSTAIGGDNQGSGFEIITDLTIDSHNNLYGTGVGEAGWIPPQPILQAPVTANIPGFFPLVDPDTNSVTEYVAQPNGEDAIVIKFNTDRAIEWSTYFGGGYIENIHVYPDGQGIGTPNAGCTAGIAVNNDGKIVISGSAQGDYTDGFPHAQMSGAYDQAQNNSWILPGMTDAFIAMFNVADSLIWSTLYGGFMYDWGFSVAVDSNDIFYFTGLTESDSLFDTYYSAGDYVQAFNQGTVPGDDAYILKFTSAGIRQYAMYYGGSNIEFPRNIVCDLDGTNIIFCGISISAASFPFADPQIGNYFNTSGTSFITNMQFDCNPCLRVGNVTENIEGAKIFSGYPYPNPAVDYIAVSDKEIKNIAVFNSLGTTVKSFSTIKSPLYIADLPVGLYLVKFEDCNKNIQTSRFIKN